MADSAASHAVPLKRIATPSAVGNGDGVASSSAQPLGSAESTSAAAAEGEGEDAPVPSSIDRVGVWVLALQHASSSFGYRAAEFAFPLFFIELFTGTLLPASIYGFVTTGAGILFSGSVGHTLDGPSKLMGTDTSSRDPTYQLRVIRNYILLQKTLVAVSYGLFLVMFYKPDLAREAANGGRGEGGNGAPNARPWTLFTAITAAGCLLILSNVGISVGIERSWVTLIARADEGRLIRLNANMRRIDLLAKLLAPLFVSLLTTVVGYPLSAVLLLAIDAGTSVFEWVWIRIVYVRFPELAEWQHPSSDEEVALANATAATMVTTVRTEATLVNGAATSSRPVNPQGLRNAVRRWLEEQWRDWVHFAKMPIFISTCSIALLYLSVLSFESTFIAYLKSETTYNDAFIAGMRGIGVAAGLLGTMLMPVLERLVGIIRAGSYSLFAQLLPLIMTLVSLYVGAEQRQRPAWNGALLFTGIALSRIGLWSFDLAQLAQVQRALNHEPRKNALMGLQFALQNFFDLGHYALTMAFHRPSQFKYAAAVSFGAVVSATVLYVAFYARRLRGHLLHLDRLGLDKLWIRKQS